MANLFLCPNKIVTGKNALQESGTYLKEFGNKALIVTDRVMVKLGNVQQIVEVLKNNGISYELFAEIDSEPTTDMVYEGLHKYHCTGCDFLVGLGGGSPIDAMKAIGALVSNQGTLVEYMGREIKNRPPGMVAIPTTAGTGSEATQFTIISDPISKVKMLLKGAVLLPDLAVVDASLTMSAPPKVTAATGIDALAHAIEAYTSKKAQPLSDAFALSAVKRIFSNLRKAYKNGDDFTARQQMSLASLEAGIAFNNSSVTIIHGMSRPIGALFHVPHGISNAMLMSECLSFAVQGAEGRFAAITREVGFKKDGMTDSEAAYELVAQVAKLCKDLDIPSLEEFGIDKAEFFGNIDKMAFDAIESGSPCNTLRSVTLDQIVGIYKRLWSK